MLAVFVFPSCRKKQEEPSVIPPNTENGSHTLGCLVNDEVWLPRYYPTLSSFVHPLALSSEFYERDGVKTFKIIGTHWQEFEDFDKEIIGIFIENSFNFDTIKLDSIRYSGTYLNYIIEPPDERREDFKSFQSIGNSNSWLLFSKFDTINRIASGTFSANLVNVADSLDSLEIRKGVFDVGF